jgi:succinate-acetate transporter protein
MKNGSNFAQSFFSMYGLFLVCYTVVHLKFEWNFWTQDDFAIFAKYAQGDSPAAHLAVAKLVYFSKATWMIVLVWLCALNISFRRALAISFLYYAVALLFLFPVNVYNALNLLLAGGFAFEEWQRHRNPSKA